MMLAHEGDGQKLKAAFDGDGVDTEAVARMMRGRTPAERRAIIAASGLDRPELAQYGEMTEAEKEEADVALEVAQLGTEDGVGVDTVAVQETMAGLEPDQPSAVAWEFRMETGERIGDALPAELLPANLREKKLDAAKLAEDSKKAAADLFKAMDGSGTDEDAILEALRGKSPREIEEIKKWYRDLHGSELMDDLVEDLDDAPEALAAARAMMSDDPVAAALAFCVTPRRGTSSTAPTRSS